MVVVVVATATPILNEELTRLASPGYYRSQTAPTMPSLTRPRAPTLTAMSQQLQHQRSWLIVCFNNNHRRQRLQDQHSDNSMINRRRGLQHQTKGDSSNTKQKDTASAPTDGNSSTTNRQDRRTTTAQRPADGDGDGSKTDQRRQLRDRPTATAAKPDGRQLKDQPKRTAKTTNDDSSENYPLTSSRPTGNSSTPTNDGFKNDRWRRLQGLATATAPRTTPPTALKPTPAPSLTDGNISKKDQRQLQHSDDGSNTT
jgi:hypothetical protein